MVYDETIHIRIKKKDFDKFKKHCDKIGKAYYEVLREFMAAAIDNRATIVSKEVSEDIFYKRYKKDLEAKLEKLEGKK